VSLRTNQVIHLKGFTPTELECYRQQIFVNICQAMAACLALLQGRGIPFEHESNRVRSLFSGEQAVGLTRFASRPMSHFSPASRTCENEKPSHRSITSR
jgi:hypothetical protein